MTILARSSVHVQPPTLVATPECAIGLNLGHGYVKAVLSDGHSERAVTFPALIAPAQRVVQGSLADVETVTIGEQSFWVGEDAVRGHALSMLTTHRLWNLHFLPALTATALLRLGIQPGAVAVSGLPAAQAEERVLGLELGKRLRAGAPSLDFLRRIKVVAEPVGGAYSLYLTADGDIDQAMAHLSARVGIIDLGHYSVDAVIIDALMPLSTSLMTLELGSSVPLQRLQARLLSVYGIDLTLYQTDQAIRRGCVRVAGIDEELPTDWRRPFIENGHAITSRLQQAWRRGADLDAVLIMGGGSELDVVTDTIRHAFPQAVVVPDGQLAIARGYARLARRLARGLD